jgi:hypothetical protein
MNSIGHALAGETGSVVSGDAERRAQLFHETPRQRLTRWALGTAYAVRPKRIAGLPGLAVLSLK